MIHLPGGVNMIFLAVLALIFFGPRKLPELMRSIGQGIAQFKKAMNEATSFPSWDQLLLTWAAIVLLTIALFAIVAGNSPTFDLRSNVPLDFPTNLR